MSSDFIATWEFEFVYELYVSCLTRFFLSWAFEPILGAVTPINVIRRLPLLLDSSLCYTVYV